MIYLVTYKTTCTYRKNVFGHYEPYNVEKVNKTYIAAEKDDIEHIKAVLHNLSMFSELIDYKEVKHEEKNL